MSQIVQRGFARLKTLAGAAGAGLVGWVRAAAGGVLRTVAQKLSDTVHVRDFGAVGDGVADDTAAVVAALAFANSRAYAGLAANLLVPGCRLDFGDGKYNLATLSAPLEIRCNVKSGAAALIVPNAYAGNAVEIGLKTDLNTIITATIELPDIYKMTGAALVPGSVGVRAYNVNASEIKFGRVSYFETDAWFGGKGEGFVYNEVHLGNFNYGKTLLKLVPEMGGVAGWCNDNKFFGGNLQQFASIGAGAVQVDIDGTVSTVAGNTFYGTSLEGNGPEWVVRAKAAHTNTFYGAHHETGSLAVPVTVSGDTWTRAAHGFAVNDVLMIVATGLPGGVFDLTPYWVVAVPTADTFKLSLNKGGTPVSVSSGGSGVTVIKQLKCLFDGTGKPTLNNTFHDLFTPFSVSLVMEETGGAVGNGLEQRNLKIASARVDSDLPIYRGQNTGFSTNRPIFAAYENTEDPEEKPGLWRTALSPRGLLWASSGAVIGRLFANTGTNFPQYQVAGGPVYDVALVIRSGTLSVSALSVPANGRTLSTHALAGAAVGDNVNVSANSPWPDGIALAWARVSAADTVQVAWHNWTGAPISLTTDFKVSAQK